MNSYDQNVTIALNTLKAYNYRDCNILLNKRCYAQLKVFFTEADCNSFSFECAINWCESLRKPIKGRYKLAILRLNDIYEIGRVRSSHLTPYGVLTQDFSNALDKYIESLTPHNYTVAHLDSIRERCRLFFRYATMNGVHSILDIDYPLLDKYHQFIEESETSYRDYEFSLINLFLFLSKQNNCHIGHAMYFRYAKFQKCTSMVDITPENQQIIENNRKCDNSISVDCVYRLIPNFKKRLSEFGYKRNMLRMVEYHLTVLCVFLDREHLSYNRSIADAWASSVARKLFGHSMVKSVSRTFDLFDDFCCEGEIFPHNINRRRTSSFTYLPSWCQHKILEYKAIKEKEGLASSTVKHCITYCSKLCLFLHETGLTSFSEITPNIIKQFNIQDIHVSSRGKNAYNSALRQFLIYLEMKGEVQEGLHHALPFCETGGERIIRILLPEDRNKIEAYCANATTLVELRDAAILRLGMDTALRASDIAALTRDNIDWNNRCIHFTQIKTGRSHLHPVRISTLNAIYRYRKEGGARVKESHSLFITLCAPYKSISSIACNDAMKRAGCSTTDFHRLRRTYATDSLRAGLSITETAGLLGHSDTTTVHKYVALDAERMRLCPLSLSETGLQIKGRYNYE